VLPLYLYLLLTISALCSCAHTPPTDIYTLSLHDALPISQNVLYPVGSRSAESSSSGLQRVSCKHRMSGFSRCSHSKKPLRCAARSPLTLHEMIVSTPYSATATGSSSAARHSPYSTLSTSASQLARMMLYPAPTVLHRFEPFCVSISTRVSAAVPRLLSRIRTL